MPRLCMLHSFFMYASAVNEREYYENSEKLLLTFSALQIAGDNDENHVRRYQSD